MKNMLMIICLMWITMSCSDCRKGDEADDFYESSFDFVIVDAATGNSIYNNASLAYYADSLKLFNNRRSMVLRSFTVNNYTSSTITNIYNPETDGASTQTRIVYLYLNATDIDTLEINFSPKFEKCYDKFESVSAKYNGQSVLLPDYNGSVNIGATLRKQL